MQMKKGKIGVRLKYMDMVVADRNNLACHSRKTMVVWNPFKNGGAALYFVDMCLGRHELLRCTNVVASQCNPSLLHTLYQYMHLRISGDRSGAK